MGRLIDADALKHDVLNQQFSLGQDSAWKFLEMIDEQFTADVKPVVRGEWVNDGKGLYKCSACNELWVGWWAVVVPIERMKKEMPFCPHCGAEMVRGEQNG